MANFVHLVNSLPTGTVVTRLVKTKLILKSGTLLLGLSWKCPKRISFEPESNSFWNPSTVLCYSVQALLIQVVPKSLNLKKMSSMYVQGTSAPYAVILKCAQQQTSIFLSQQWCWCWYFGEGLARLFFGRPRLMMTMKERDAREPKPLDFH